MQVVNKISCVNHGGFKMKFRVRWDAGKSGYTIYYFNPGSETMDLTNFNIPDGGETWIEVSVMSGKKKSAKDHVLYSSSAQATATYRVTGASLTYDITLEGSK